MRWTIAMAPALLALLMSAVGGQAKPSRECSDGRGKDRCSIKEHEATLKLFGAPSVDRHRAAGDVVRRVFYVDSSGSDLLAIAFIRPRGRDPGVKVYLPQIEGEQPRPPMEATVPADVWDEVVRRSAHFERRLGPAAALPDNVVSVCGHPWTYIAEAVDAPAVEEVPQQIRRKTDDGCTNGLVEVLAEDLSSAAVPLFPHCARLDPRRYAPRAMLLLACSVLSGDRAAAAEALNLFDEFQDGWEKGSLEQLDRHFAIDAELAWDGVVVPQGGGDAAALLHARLKGPPHHYLSFDTIEGIDADRVRATATVSRETNTDGAHPADERATVELLWVRNGERLQIQRATVGRFQPVRKP